MKMIQLKQVLRNKRFLLFTIFVPVIWYVFISNVQKGVLPNIVFGIAVFIGIIGNSLATFSKRIATNIEFYSFESRFTRYAVKDYLLDQMLVQLALNTLIFMAVLAFAVSVFNLHVTAGLVVQFLLLTVMGIYFSIIGFVLGVRVDAKTLDTISFPAIILAAMTIIPFASLGADGGFIGAVSKIQMIFPGYYYSEIVTAISSGRPVDSKDVMLFLIVFILNIIPLYLIVPRVKEINGR